LAQKALPEELRPLLILLGLHERFIHLEMFADMAKQVSQDWTTDKIRRFADSLSHTGLLHERGPNLYELHPALTGYLRAFVVKSESEQTHDLWTKAFVNVMGMFADSLTLKQLHEKRIPFHCFGASFHYAMNEAQRLSMDLHYRRILQSLAAYADNRHNYKEAEDLCLRLAEFSRMSGDTQFEAIAYHQLGNIALEKRDFDKAEDLYDKSLEIKEKHQDKPGVANIYHQLGAIAEERQNFEDAEKLYQKSLKIKEMHGDEHGAANTYHQLGGIAEARQNLDDAENYYRKALGIKEKHGDEYGAAKTYHSLGMLAAKRRDFKDAEKWSLKALEIFQKNGDEHGAAMTYHQLGIIASERQNFEDAKKWFHKALEIFQKNGDEYGAAITYENIGVNAGYQGHFEESGKWLIKALHIFSKYNAPADVQQSAQNFKDFYKQADPETQANLKALWESAGLGEMSVV